MYKDNKILLVFYIINKNFNIILKIINNLYNLYNLYNINKINKLKIIIKIIMDYKILNNNNYKI